MVRAIAVAILLCLGATSALPYGAVAVNTSGSTLTTSQNRKTPQEAIREVIDRCRARPAPGDPCKAITVFKNQCVGVVMALPSTVLPSPPAVEFFSATAANLSEAQANAVALCVSAYDISHCVSHVHFCDVTEGSPNSADLGLVDFLSGWFYKRYAVALSWWGTNVSTSVLVVVGVLIVLAAGLAYMMLQMRRLRRMLASRADPLRTVTDIEKTWRTAQPGTSGPELDTKAIKEAIKPNAKRREEFEL